MAEFQLKFADLSGRCIAALERAFAGVEGATFRRCSVAQVLTGCTQPVCIADAGNSFAMMDGKANSIRVCTSINGVALTLDKLQVAWMVS